MQGNGQVFLRWNLVAGATSYSVKRSTDGVTYSVLSSPAINNYLDTTCSVGTQYFYQVASVNASGTSSYTNAQSIVPALTGEMSLGQIRMEAQLRADMYGSNFVTLPEWNSYINQSYFELYDLLIDTYEDYYLAPAITFTSDGTTFQYPLPNGTNYGNAPLLYKLMGVDCGGGATNQWFTVDRFNFIDRNKYIYPNTGSTYFGAFNLKYKLIGNSIMFIPTPSAGQPIRVWYVPRLAQVLQDTDMIDGISGWTEYVIVDAAIKALQKEESDVSILGAQKMALIKRIEDSAVNRDAGQGDTISDTRRNSQYDRSSGFEGGWE